MSATGSVGLALIDNLVAGPGVTIQGGSGVRLVGNRTEGPVTLATGQVLLGAGFLLPVLVFSEVLGHRDARASFAVGSVAGMLALGVLGSGIAYVLNFRIIAAVGGSTASAVTYLTPVVAVIVGVAFLSEPLTWFEPTGAGIVLLGVALTRARVAATKR